MNMRTSKNLQRFSSARRWFLLALVLSGLFIVCTAIYATGILEMPILSVESWLLNRPIGGVDCVFFEWRHVGEVPASLFLALAMGIICWRAGYSWKVIPILFVLLTFCSIIELIGKKVFTLSLPPNLLSGMTDLSCPQIHQNPTSVRLETMFGLWWKIPAPVAGQVRWVRTIAQMPVVSMPTSSFTERLRSYPGGHAARWCFLGLITCWLCWKHIRHRVGRMLLTSLFFLASFLGGFMQFYIGVHTLADTIAGYLLGAAAACCAIGLLIIFSSSEVFLE
ncbi:MAG TPA: phosphatase PAP2 family protein [Ktedonobacteraceae bacterium]|jgi:membrane-associated phospholipid phosphatase